MKNKQKWWKLLLALLLGLGLGGCSDDDDSSGSRWQGDSALVGYWRLAEVTVTPRGSNPVPVVGWEMWLRLYGNGTASATEVRESKTQSLAGTWSSRGTELRPTLGAYNWTGDYRVTTSRFTLSDVPNHDGKGTPASFTFLRL